MDAMAITTTAAVLFVSSLLVSDDLGSTSTAAVMPPSPPTSCSTSIVLFSPCLPYVSSPPNDLDSSVTSWCCGAYSSVLGSGSGICLCYLFREPGMLGFPLNNTRLLSLSSDCSLLNASFVNRGTLDSLCSASPPLPLLRNNNGSAAMQPEPGDSPASISPPKASPPPLDSVAGSKAAPSYAPEPADISPEPSDDVMDSSATELFATTKRSRLQGSASIALIAIVVGHL
ncbi:hypothetical protein SAY86_020814 [Trapa natans]|uniref:Bifunctional inhibitor/plant lipid transfer protein/seed storage helical domain-containing protein n=1 Tax=Trapa natans TaxID=22666 RepID=A0AAN7REB3_TRANT|nr:hypothetical protein SAY86_020814 [Trapa natans]